MKTLLLLRHAKSGWEEPDQRDFDRTLNERGRATAEAAGKYFLDHVAMPDAVLCSPAVRTTQTWTHVQAQTKWPLTPVLEKDIYMASAEQLLGLVQALPEPAATCLMIGHNPGFEDLALALAVEGDADLRASLAEKFPTASLAQIDFAVDAWAEVDKGKGILTKFVRPRDLGFGPDAEG